MAIGENCSTKAFKDYLFKDLGLPILKTTASDKEAADDMTMILLKEWCDENKPELSTLFTLVQEYRKWGKIKSTYIDGYLKHRNSATGNIHPELFALSTDTGRMNCRNPNAQNMPRKSNDPILFKVIYQCNHKFKGKEKCSTPKLEEEQIKELFVKAVNLLITDAKEIIRNYEEARPLIFDTECFDAEITELQEEMTVTAELIQKCVDENARTAISQDKYKKKYDALVKRFEKAKKRLQEIHDTKRDREARRLQTDHFMRELKKQESIITEFDEVLWYTLVDRITVYNETDIRFTFKDGTEYRV